MHKLHGLPAFLKSFFCKQYKTQPQLKLPTVIKPPIQS